MLRLMNISQPHISLPARLALWLGVIIVAVAFVKKISFLMVVGVVFILLGGAIWWFHAETRWALPQWMQRVGRACGTKLKQILSKFKPKFKPKTGSKRETTHQALESGIEQGKQSLKRLNDVVEEHHRRYNGKK